MRWNAAQKVQIYLGAFTHNPEVVGSSPASATKENTTQTGGVFFGYEASFKRLPGYETDERSSLGERADRRQWRRKEGERVAAVDKTEEKRKPEDFIGHRNRAQVRVCLPQPKKTPKRLVFGTCTFQNLTIIFKIILFE